MKSTEAASSTKKPVLKKRKANNQSEDADQDYVGEDPSKTKQTTMRRMLNIIKIQQRVRMEKRKKKKMQDKTRKMLLAGMAN